MTIRSSVLSVAKYTYQLLPSRIRPFITKLVFPIEREVKTVELGLLIGMKMEVSPRTERAYLYGSYEPEVQAALRRLVHSGMVVFDLGANAGYFALGLCRLVGKGGKVVAFEPNAPSVEQLRRNIDLNSLVSRVAVEALAVSDYDGTAEFSTSVITSKAANDYHFKTGQGK
jgi:Met-10+ like-protein